MALPDSKREVARPAGARRWHATTLRILIIGKRERAAAARSAWPAAGSWSRPPRHACRRP